MKHTGVTCAHAMLANSDILLTNHVGLSSNVRGAHMTATVGLDARAPNRDNLCGIDLLVQGAHFAYT